MVDNSVAVRNWKISFTYTCPNTLQEVAVMLTEPFLFTEEDKFGIDKYVDIDICSSCNKPHTITLL